MEDLDRIDLKILRALQADGKMANAELAQRVSLSPASCHRRVQRLHREGFIAGTRAMIAPDKVDQDLLVIVGVVLERATAESFAAFEEGAKKLPFLLDCLLVAGDFDYFLKIRVKDMNAFKRYHADKLITLPGVRQTRTFFVMKEVKDNGLLEF